MQYLAENLQKIIRKVVQRNGFFAHSENVLLAMLCDEECAENRLQAISLIKKIRDSSHNNGIRKFEIPLINFDAKKYTEIIDWKGAVTEPPLTKN